MDMADQRDARSVAKMTTTEVSIWLEQEGVSASVAEIFDGMYK